MSAPLPAPEPSPKRQLRGQALLAWVVILAVCVFLVWRNVVADASGEPPKSGLDPKKPNPVLLLAAAAMLFTAVTGLLLLILWVVFVANGTLRLRLRAFPRYGAIYAETFALWLVLFIGLQFAVPLIPAGKSRLLVSGLAMLFSVTAVAWPLVRGVRWGRVRYDLGLHAGTAEPGIELLCGLGGYAAALAMAFAGALVTFGLMALRKKLAPSAPDTMPSHPAAGLIIDGDLWVRLQVLFTAAVVAPIVEEIMFRGVLYRHLRELSYRWGKVMSICAGTMATSFVFAAIHPQGWLGIPPLMGLAAVFTLTREWRGSLLPSMVAHGVNNAVVTVVLIAM